MTPPTSVFLRTNEVPGHRDLAPPCQIRRVECRTPGSPTPKVNRLPLFSLHTRAESSISSLITAQTLKFDDASRPTNRATESREIHSGLITRRGEKSSLWALPSSVTKHIKRGLLQEKMEEYSNVSSTANHSDYETSVQVGEGTSPTAMSEAEFWRRVYEMERRDEAEALIMEHSPASMLSPQVQTPEDENGSAPPCLCARL
jgi:hypothetical protein